MFLDDSFVDPSADDSNIETLLYSNIKPKFVFGLVTGISGNCLYLNDHVIVYPAAGVVVVHDLDAHSQRFVYPKDPRRTITAMDLSPMSYVLAVATVAENDGGGHDDDKGKIEDYAKPIVKIYDLESLSEKHVFVEPEGEWQKFGQRRFTKIRFQNDNVHLAALVVGDDGSDCGFYFYGWRNSKVETYIRIDGFVADVAMNPFDLSLCCFAGREFFQFMTKTETGWSQYGFREAEGIDFTCVCWLCRDRCLAGTTDGRVILFKNGLFQSMYYVDEVHDIDVTIKSKSENLSIIILSEFEMKSKSVRSCIAFEYGLIVVAGEFNIYHFQKRDNGERYMRNNMYVKHNHRHLKTLEIEGESPLHFVESVCISPNSKILTCVTKNAQLHSAPLHYRQKNLEDDDEDLFNSIIEIQPFHEELHHGGVGSLSTSLWRPLLMTGGKIDFTVKLWDYAKCTLLLSKHYYYQVLSVSLHPTALYSVVAFTGHVEFQIIRIDDLVPLKHFPIMDCSVTGFSGSGHMFALAKPSGEIEIYSTLNLKKCFSCGSHLSPIGTLVWSHLDKSIIVYDKAGALYAFHPVDGHVLMHIVPYPDVTITDLAVTEEINKMYFIAEDGIIRKVDDNKVVREINVNQGPLHALSISKSNRVLFLATKNGVIMSVTLSVINRLYAYFTVHNHRITKMCLAMDGSVLISCSEDGSMCIWEVEEVVNKKDNIDDRFKYFDDLLVKTLELEKINRDKIEIRNSVDLLEEKNKYNINKFKYSKEQELNNLKKMNADDIDKTRSKLNFENQIQNEVLCKLENEVTALKEANILSLENLDVQYTRKLMYKYNKYSDLENKTAEFISKRKKSIDELKLKFSNELQNTIANLGEQFKDKQEEMLKLRDKEINEKNNLRMLVGETENDVDEHVLDKKNAFIAKLKKMKELNLKASYELAVDKIKYNSFLEDNSELMRLTDNAEQDFNELQLSISEIAKRITILKRSLKNESENILKKDIEINDIYQKASELEKEINVITEINADLQKVSDSLTTEIKDTKNVIDKVENQYNNMIKKKKFVKYYFTKLEDYKNDVKSKLDKHKSLIRNTKKSINQIEVDLRLASQNYNNDNDNKAALTTFFNKYTGDLTIQNEDIGARNELLRQIKLLEDSISRLKKDAQSSNYKSESNYLIMKENMKLIDEISDLRKDSQNYLTQCINLKRTLLKITHPNQRT